MMENEKRLIDANALLELVQFRLPIDNQNAEVIAGCVDITRRLIENAPTVDAVEVTCIEEVKQAILQTFDNLIAIHRDISNSQFANSAQYLNIPESSNDYNGIYADAMEVARRFVNAALTDLCDKNGRWNENG